MTVTPSYLRAALHLWVDYVYEIFSGIDCLLVILPPLPEKGIPDCVPESTAHSFSSVLRRRPMWIPALIC